MKKIKKSIYEPLDNYEKQLIKDLENNEFVPVPNQEVETKRYVSYFKNYVKNMPKKNKRIALRVANEDLEKIQEKAIISGIPYQTLISSLIRQFANDRININI
ncbi:antitoxin [bacterium]|uniref:Antitoxin n=2 Tax=Candidatus Roizmaniibacteriota TaxID=1752723 RepID=A0A2M6YTC0_9BACT|nr:antitoxin [bacterium]PIU36780.1 MAG: antitoxin [Candidatus Roizmanbacteria bacterium CG07_land_8_20_14_0_80_34_15]PIW73633.1 MAG: antitoxin [Candidatus Roizmanbacteria bacterium CG_4_8_14_3_um_filter_34_9]